MQNIVNNEWVDETLPFVNIKEQMGYTIKHAKQNIEVQLEALPQPWRKKALFCHQYILKLSF